MNKPVTMQDVANKAGVSRATVSLALRKSPKIKEATRTKVDLAAKGLGYQSNPMVTALMMSRRRRRIQRDVSIIAYLRCQNNLPYSTRLWHSVMREGAKKRANELGFYLEDFILGEDGYSHGRLASILRARGIGGILLAPLLDDQRSIQFDFKSFAAVGLGMSIQHPSVERVSLDHYHASQLAIRECRSLGYRRIGLVLRHNNSFRLDHRWVGGYQTCQLEIPKEDAIQPLLLDNTDKIHTVASRWIREHSPDLILSGLGVEDRIALLNQLPLNIGFATLVCDELGSNLSGVYEDYGLTGAMGIDLLATKLYYGTHCVDDLSRLHMCCGIWNRGKTAPGPNKRRVRDAPILGA